MSVDTSTGPFCGALGCREAADVVIHHAEYGRRAVCDDHAEDHAVVERLDGGRDE